MLFDEAPQVFQSFGAAAENDLAPSVESIFPLGWSSKGLPVDLRASYFQLSSPCLDIPMKHCLSCLIYYILPARPVDSHSQPCNNQPSRPHTWSITHTYCHRHVKRCIHPKNRQVAKGYTPDLNNIPPLSPPPNNNP